MKAAGLWQNTTTQTNKVQLAFLKSYKTYRNDIFLPLTVQPSTWSEDNFSFVDPNIVKTVWTDSAQIVDAVTAGLIIGVPLNITNDTISFCFRVLVDARGDESHHVQTDGPLDLAMYADVTGLRKDDSMSSGFLLMSSRADINSRGIQNPGYFTNAPSFDIRNETFFGIRLLTGHHHIPFQAVSGLLTSSMYNISYRDLSAETTGFSMTLDHRHPPFVAPMIPAYLRFYATLNVTATEDTGPSPYELTNDRILQAFEALGWLLAWQVDPDNMVEWEFELIVSNPWPTVMKTIARGGFAQPLNRTKGTVATS